jgi:hypothetical protein
MSLIDDFREGWRERRRETEDARASDYEEWLWPRADDWREVGDGNGSDGGQFAGLVALCEQQQAAIAEGEARIAELAATGKKLFAETKELRALYGALETLRQSPGLYAAARKGLGKAFHPNAHHGAGAEAARALTETYQALAAVLDRIERTKGGCR